MSNFWEVTARQLAQLRQARNADDVVDALSPSEGGVADAFFGGSGGDDSVWEALEGAGWQPIWWKASYHYAMKAPDGSVITYVEGDIYRGDTREAVTSNA